MLKHFLESDVERGHQFPTVYAALSEFLYCPLPWQKMGLHQTASGYGCKLTSAYKISFEGRLYRLYHSCYGNASSCWFVRTRNKMKETIYVN